MPCPESVLFLLHPVQSYQPSVLNARYSELCLFLIPVGFPSFLMNLASHLKEFQLLSSLVSWDIFRRVHFSLNCYWSEGEVNTGYFD